MANASETGKDKARSSTRDRAGRETLRSWAPATGALLGEVPVATTEDVERAVARARRAQEAWALLPVEERAERVLRYRNALVDRAEEVVDLEVRETGKTRHEALISEVFVVADVATYYAKNARRLLAPQPIEMVRMKHRRSYVHYVPRGVVAVISPWNFPVVLSLSDTLTALIAGNAVVCKPSEITPLVVQKCKEIWDAAGLPPDLFQVVHGHGEVGADLIAAGVDKVVFTGGVATGRKVAAACGERLVPCVLELGGKAPLIACADADIERTARAIVFGGFANSGQICLSVERVYAHESVHDLLLERVVGLVSELRQGDPATGDVDVGAMTFPRQVEVVEAHIEDALAKGAVLRAGGKRRPGAGMFFEPTVLARCDHRMTVMTEEIFGPIVPFMKVGSEEEAIALANDSHLGLDAYVFTRDRDRGCRIAERVVAGSVVVNDVLANYAYPEAPFGGVKASGIGRVHGDDALRDMCQARHVNVDRFGSLEREPFWHPYDATTYKVILKATRALFGGGGLVQKLSELL
ncbi:MAG: aldehyde dehydrogenase family protein [Deltaproteobacteria bacterium]|nr:aldehyde dehydrogenase family protein [Deltaproteobacteria bacterium]